MHGLQIKLFLCWYNYKLCNNGPHSFGEMPKLCTRKNRCNWKYLIARSSCKYKLTIQYCFKIEFFPFNGFTQIILGPLYPWKVACFLFLAIFYIKLVLSSQSIRWLLSFHPLSHICFYVFWLYPLKSIWIQSLTFSFQNIGVPQHRLLSDQSISWLLSFHHLPSG